MKTQLGSYRLLLLAFLSGIVLTPLCAYAQSTSLLRGTITDPQGAVIGEATVTLKNAQTGFTRQTFSNATGEYHFLQVAPGTYDVTVEKPGFSTITRADTKLLVNTPTSLDLRMDLGKTSDTVNVTAEASTINTVDASIGNAFSEQQVRQLPLQTRNVVELLSLQPGVTTSGEVLGARRDQNNITLDGVDVNDNQNAGLVTQNSATGVTYQGVNGNNANVNSGFNAVLPIPLDSVQEFRVTVGGEGADQGRSSGGQVVLVTKGGTNQFHGSLYEYNRNTATSANTWFNNQSGVPVQQLVRNQFGASVGGPIKKDRAFFFVNWEQRKDASSVAQVRAVPSESLKQGMLNVQLTDGSVQTLTPADLAQVDPLHIGLNAGYQKILQQYPAGNNPAFGQDGGLNFSGFRFNAPDHLNNMAWVARLDYRLDSAGKHNLSVRGTLADNTQDQILAQFPGQSPASTERDNSKGISIRYTAILTPRLINSFTYGLTRLGQQFSGVAGTGFEFEPTALSSLENFNARAKGRTNPLHNFSDDVTWTKGKHTITAGLNFRFSQNNISAFTNSYPLYAYQATELIGLGEDINTAVTNFLGGNVQLANPTAVTNASAMLLGLLNDEFVTYQYTKNGQVLPQGTVQQRSFIAHSYAGYIGDSFRVRRDLTLTFGLRYENYRPPYEANGLQVAPTVGLNQFFAERNGLQAQGVPANQMPDFTLQYALNGPANGKESWWTPDNNNFAPRFALAYAPADHGGWIGKLFGKNGAFRVGGALAYDQFGNDIIANYDQFGSLGLSEPSFLPDSFSFSTSPRFTGTFPALPPAAPGGFPFTPPSVAAITGTFMGISPNLRTPYSMILNASFSRELPGKMTMEVGYMGRLSRKLLMQGDVFTPLENFKDPKSGITWQQNAQIVYNLANSLAKKLGLPYNAAASTIAAAVAANPSLVPDLPFVDNVWPGYANSYIPGASASANYFYSVYGIFGSSFLDSLHAADRIAGNSDYGLAPGQCLSITGCYTFFAKQGSSMPMWMNAGQADFHAMTIALRRRFSNGFQFDFNYTWSHSIDNGSAAESGAGQQGASIQDVFNPGAFRGSSDFDIRHNFNANFMYELPIGKGRLLLRKAPGWVDAIVGGWQISNIWRYSTPLPSAVAGDLAYNTNYWLSSLAIVNTPTSSGGVHIDQNGNPSIFTNTNISNNFQDQPPEGTGTRAAVRLAPIFNVDMAVAKVFRLPWEGQRIQLRAEAFNVLNHPNFTNPSLNLQSPLTFGEFQGTMDPRSMQFALRYEF